MNLAAIQWNSSVDVAENLASLEHWLRQLPNDRPMLVVIPEMFASFAGQAGNNMAIAETLGDGPVQRALQGLCQQFAVWLVAGTFPIKSDDVERYYACSLVFDELGQVQGSYNKIHLFDAVVNDATGLYRESATTKAGSHLSVVPSPFGRIGQTVCYDVRFPGLFMALVEQQVDIIVVPSAFTVTTGQAHWRTLLQARAIESQCYIIAPDQGGAHANGRQTYGHSLIVSPWGEILAELGTEPGVIIAKRDVEYQTSLRQRMPVAVHNQFSARWNHA